MFTLSTSQCHCAHRCNTIGLSSVCFATVFVPEVEAGERANMPKPNLASKELRNVITEQSTVSNL